VSHQNTLAASKLNRETGLQCVGLDFLDRLEATVAQQFVTRAEEGAGEDFHTFTLARN
jgi:hypothetical protein